MDRDSNRKYLISEIYKICDLMPTNVFKIFYNKIKLNSKSKRIYEMLAEGFCDLKAYCCLMNNDCWSQAAIVLRTAIERISKLKVLSSNKDYEQRFIDRYYERVNYNNLSKTKQKQFKKERNLTKNFELNNYFEYDWANINENDCIYDRNKFLELCKMESLQKDFENTLNSFTHQDISIFQFSGSDDSWNLMRRQGRRMDEIVIRLYYCLVFSLHNFLDNPETDLITDLLYDKVCDYINLEI